MSCKEQQEEEIEVLQSIYDGDEAFKQASDTCFQYKIGEDGTPKSFLLEITWGEDYPESMPEISLNAFYNKHISDGLKSSIGDKLKEEGEASLGCAMTYTLFEYAKENAEELMAEQPEVSLEPSPAEKKPASQQATAKPKVKKEQLTKAQKRKITNRLDNQGEVPRGYDWIDVIKHLSQTGKASDMS